MYKCIIHLAVSATYGKRIRMGGFEAQKTWNFKPVQSGFSGVAVVCLRRATMERCSDIWYILRVKDMSQDLYYAVEINNMSLATAEQFEKVLRDLFVSSSHWGASVRFFLYSILLHHPSDSSSSSLLTFREENKHIYSFSSSIQSEENDVIYLFLWRRLGLLHWTSCLWTMMVLVFVSLWRC